MRFVVHDPVLNGDERVLDLMDRLVDRLADEVHRVEVRDVDLLRESSWFQKARSTRRTVLMAAVAKPPRLESYQRGPHIKTLDVVDEDSAELAYRLAHTPLSIMVEDRESDGVFLDIIVEELGWPDLQALWKNEMRATPRATEVITAGGKPAMPQRIARAVRDAAHEGRSVRLFVLCDSDLKWPGDFDPKVVAIAEACARYNVRCHVLRKRCAENYIPDEVFEARCESPDLLSYVDRIRALLRLSRTQRDHFPFKGGLSATERADAINAGLYDLAEEEDLKLLEKSLFKSRPRPFLQLNSEHRESFTAQGLRTRDGEAELENLLQAIAEEL